jgi:hypothetical protein
MCPPLSRHSPESVLDFWCTWFLSRKSGFVRVVPGLAAELIQQVRSCEEWKDDSGLSDVVSWLMRFSDENEQFEIGGRHEFNLLILALIRRYVGSMSETGKIILLNVISSVEKSPI